MTVRAIIMALTVPLFLLIAAINGAVLYFQEQSELSLALDEQARSAAVVVGEFIAEMEDPANELAQPLRREALANAVAQIEGLQGLYLLERSGSVTPLAMRVPEWEPEVDWQGEAARFAQIEVDDQFFAAIVPAGEGRAVAARVDAAPLAANRSRIGWILAAIIAGVSVVAAALGWIVAGRVVRELGWIGRYFAAPAETEPACNNSIGDKTVLTIRETRDLADAVSLMRASHAAAETRHQRHAARKDRERSIESAAAVLQRETFADIDIDEGARTIAVRLLGDVPVGAFYAFVTEGGESHVVLGRCAGEGSDGALANAVAARSFIASNLSRLGRETCLELARKAFRVEQIEAISTGEARAFACIASPQTGANAERIAANSESLSPSERLGAIDALLEPDGIFASVAISR
ncbi:MAG: hypothetical protein ACX930_07955 [Erythrobacter sp.]